MTPTELREVLEALADEAFDEFRRDFGGSGDRDHYVEFFVAHPQHERRICHLLSRKTEAEKALEVDTRSAGAAERSAAAAERSAKAAEASQKQAVLARAWAAVASAATVVTATLALAGHFACPR